MAAPSSWTLASLELDPRADADAVDIGRVRPGTIELEVVVRHEELGRRGVDVLHEADLVHLRLVANVLFVLVEVVGELDRRGAELAELLLIADVGIVVDRIPRVVGVDLGPRNGGEDADRAPDGARAVVAGAAGIGAGVDRKSVG